MQLICIAQCWQQVLKARPDVVDGVFLLFPTISFIGDTPNGRWLSVIMFPCTTLTALTMLSVADAPTNATHYICYISSRPRAC